MPFYRYRCQDCGRPDMRLAGLDDHIAICVHCRGLMYREDDDLFAPYFTEEKPCEKQRS